MIGWGMFPQEVAMKAKKVEAEKRGRGRPPLHGKPPAGAVRVSIYCTPAELARVLAFLKEMREERLR
jgi:hypothetical protein